MFLMDKMKEFLAFGLFKKNIFRNADKEKLTKK